MNFTRASAVADWQCQPQRVGEDVSCRAWALLLASARDEGIPGPPAFLWQVRKARATYSMVVLGSVLVRKQQLDRAEPLLEQARSIFRQQSFARQLRLVAVAENWLGAVQLGRREYAQAERLLLPLSELFLAPTVQMSPKERREALGHLVQLYEEWGKPEEAARWRAKLNSI